jgi:hypothetical protein
VTDRGWGGGGGGGGGAGGNNRTKRHGRHFITILLQSVQVLDLDTKQLYF